MSSVLLTAGFILFILCAIYLFHYIFKKSKRYIGLFKVSVIVVFVSILFFSLTTLIPWIAFKLDMG